MIDPIRELKVRAEILHRQAAEGEAAAAARLVALPEFRREGAEALQRAAPGLSRKHWLAIVSREVGFKSWEHASRVLGGETDELDFGRMLYPPRFSAYLNLWFNNHAEAREARQTQGGYLLAYDRQFFVAPSGFVEALGLDPLDPDWEAMDWDWPHPKDPAARLRLYSRLIAQTARAA